MASGSAALASGEAVASASVTVAATTVAAETIVKFASDNRPGNNKKQNQQFRDVMKELKVTDKNKMRRVHDKIKGRNMGYRDLLDFAKEILKLK